VVKFGCGGSWWRPLLERGVGGRGGSKVMQRLGGRDLFGSGSPHRLPVCLYLYLPPHPLPGVKLVFYIIFILPFLPFLPLPLCIMKSSQCLLFLWVICHPFLSLKVGDMSPLVSYLARQAETVVLFNMLYYCCLASHFVSNYPTPFTFCQVEL
jgi:hypothetical protein